MATQVLKWHSHNATFCFTKYDPLQPTLSPPWVKPLATPSPPFYERWSRAQQVAVHYFRPGFVSLPLPFPSLPIYLRSALQSVARPVQLPESSYMGRQGLHDTARARASPPTTLPDSPRLKSPHAQPTGIHKNQITTNCNSSLFGSHGILADDFAWYLLEEKVLCCT